jgi:hypothetical protein
MGRGAAYMTEGKKIGLIVALLILGLVAVGRCSVSKRSENSLGIVQYDSNPLMYMAATIAHTEDAVTNVDGNLNLRLKPIGTYMLYDESVLLCGMPMDKFQGITEPFVLTYERVSRRSVHGVGCHNLLRVDSLKTKERPDAKP